MSDKIEITERIEEFIDQNFNEKFDRRFKRSFKRSFKKKFAYLKTFLINPYSNYNFDEELSENAKGTLNSSYKESIGDSKIPKSRKETYESEFGELSSWDYLTEEEITIGLKLIEEGFKELEAIQVMIAQRKIKCFISTVNESLLEREEVCRVMCLAIYTRENLFMYGPPGTAKSAIAEALEKFANINENRFFRYLMTEYTKYHEIFGEEISAGDGEVSRRKIDKKTPTAFFVFMDEIFKANAQILNSCLTLFNEKKFDNGYEGTIDVPLFTALAASNEFPRTSSLRALYERFALRIPVLSVKEKENIHKLLKGEFQSMGAFEQVEMAEIIFFSTCTNRVNMSVEIMEYIREICKTLDFMHNMNNNIEEGSRSFQISSRTQAKFGKIIKASAFINGRLEVNKSDILIGRYMFWDNMRQREGTLPKINELLFQTSSHFEGRIKKELIGLNEYFERFIMNFKPYIQKQKFIQNDKEFESFRGKLIDFYSNTKTKIVNAKEIVIELEENIENEKEIQNNIFLAEDYIFEWRVKEFPVEVIDRNWEIINNEYPSEDYVVKVGENEEHHRNYYLGYNLIRNALRIDYTIKKDVEAWLHTHEAYFMYEAEIKGA